MEMRRFIDNTRKLGGLGLVVLFLLAASCTQVLAQPGRAYIVKDGRMFIIMDKQIKEPSLDSFIIQYDLHDLALKEFIKKGFKDSIQGQGWKIVEDNDAGFVISKPLFGLDNINNPGNKINFTQNDQSISSMFPAVHNTVTYGYNLFKNKSSFAINDSLVRFYLRGNTNARKVMLAGSFNGWVPDALAMIKTDSGWITTVKLGPGKYWYKFIVDGNWITDNDNRLAENDGLGNMNSVFYKTNVLFSLNGYTNAKRVYLSGSFNNWNPDELLMSKTSTGWNLPLYLAEGTHTYKFVADGNWIEDPGNKKRLPNEFNDFNSVIQIGKPYLFFLDGYPDAKQVVLSGSFNNWRQDELYMNKTAKGWELPYTLGPGNYEYTFIIDGRGIAKPDKTGSGNLFFIIEPNHTFRLKGFKDAKKVFLSGDFNNWSPNTFTMKKEDDDWILTVHLSPGKHLYKFVVDGKWIIDPANKLWEQNEEETGNSVIWVDP
jgi:hypothetical protein